MTSKVLLLVAIVAGLGAAFATHLYIERQTKSLEILVARETLPAGKPIAAEHLQRVAIPIAFDSISRFAVKREDSVVVIGQAPTVDIPAGEPVLYEYFDQRAPKREVLEHLNPGERAISISVSMESSVANIIEPGDYVDVVATFETDADQLQQPAALSRLPRQDPETEDEGAPGAGSTRELLGGAPSTSRAPRTLPSAPIQGGLFTRTLLQRMYVLGVGQNFGERQYRLVAPERNAYSVVTLRATPEEAELLVFARELGGKLTLTLRDDADMEHAEIDDMDFGTFRNFAQERLSDGAADAS